MRCDWSFCRFTRVGTLILYLRTVVCRFTMCMTRGTLRHVHGLRTAITDRERPVWFHVILMLYIALSIYLIIYIYESGGVCRSVSRVMAGDRRPPRRTARCWTSSVPCRRCRPVGRPLRHGGVTRRPHNARSAGMLVPGGMMPMGAMFPGGVLPAAMMQPRYR